MTVHLSCAQLMKLNWSNVWSVCLNKSLTGGCISEYMAAKLPEMSHTQPVILAMCGFSLN